MAPLSFPQQHTFVFPLLFPLNWDNLFQLFFFVVFVVVVVVIFVLFVSTGENILFYFLVDWTFNSSSALRSAAFTRLLVDQTNSLGCPHFSAEHKLLIF